MNDVFPPGGLALYCGFPIHHSSPYSSVICRLVILPSQIPQMVKDMELPRTTLVTAEKCLLPRMWLKKTRLRKKEKELYQWMDRVDRYKRIERQDMIGLNLVG